MATTRKGRRKAASKVDPSTQALAQLGPHQDFDILVPGDALEWSPDVDERGKPRAGSKRPSGLPIRRFFYQPLSDQTLAQILHDEAARTAVRIGAPATDTASGAASLGLASAREICEAALVGWEGLRDQAGREVEFQRSLIPNLGRAMLVALSDAIYSASLERREEKKSSGPTLRATSSGS